MFDKPKGITLHLYKKGKNILIYFWFGLLVYKNPETIIFLH